MAKTFWFQRKSDKSYLPVDGEQPAALMMKDKNFDKNFKYIGVSNGNAFRMVIAGKKLDAKEKTKAMKSGSYDKKHKSLYDEAFAAELASAKKGVKPIYESNVDMDGSLRKAGLKPATMFR